MCGDVGRSKEAEAWAGGRVVLAPASDSRLLCHLGPGGSIRVFDRVAPRGCCTKEEMSPFKTRSTAKGE